MSEDRKRSFPITITYFKETGKYYEEAKWNVEATAIINGPSVTCYMHDVTDWVRAIRDGKAPDGIISLPGLAGSSWSGFILVDCEEGYPCLVLPKHLDPIDRSKKYEPI